MSTPQSNIDFSKIAEPEPKPAPVPTPKRGPKPRRGMGSAQAAGDSSRPGLQSPPLDFSVIAEPAAHGGRRSSSPAAAATPSTRTPYAADDYSLDGDWSPERAESVKSWFKQTYGRDLPNTFGQTTTHTSMGLDHSGNMDVHLNPTSAEGRALIGFLRQSGIPFLAYNSAKEGAATGPHIHVGNPSHRLGSGAPAVAGFDFSSIAEPADGAEGATGEEAGEVVTVNASTSAPSVNLPPLPERQTFNPATLEGRQMRDARTQAERAPGAFLEVAVPLPSEDKLSDVAAGAEMVRGAYVRAMVARGVPESDAEKTVGFDYSLKNAKGEQVAPADAISDDNTDYRARTMRVKIDAAHLSKLIDGYRSGSHFGQRLADWVRDDTHSLGEKALDVAGTVAAPVAKGAGYVARPFQAASAGVFSGLRGNNPLREAYNTFTTGETSQAGSNPVGSYLRDSAVLNRINPRLGRLLGGGADLILDPANLIGLGVLGKGAKALAGAGRLGRAAEEVGALGRSLGLLERGLVEARPLGIEAAALDDAAEVARLEGRLRLVTETARKLRAGESLTPEETALVEEMRAAAEALPSPAVQSEQLRYARDRAEHYAREAESAAHPAARRTAQELAEDYAKEVERLENLGDGWAVATSASAPPMLAPDDPLAAAASKASIVPPGPKSPLWKRSLALASDLISLPKAKAAFDLSAVGRQGLPQILARPRFFWKAMREQVRSFVSQDSFDEFAEAVRSRPDYDRIQESGLFLSSPRGEHEEVFLSRLARKIPGVHASDRAYSVALDNLRLQAWDLYTSQLGPGATSKTFREAAELVNITTGRGVVPLLDRSALGRKVVQALNVPFFSPRTMASRFNILSPYRLVRNYMDPATRPVAIIQAREGARALATLGTTLTLLDLVPGVDVGWNPLEREFGKVRVGNSTYDLTGGEGHAARYASQMFRSIYHLSRGERVGWRQRPEELTARYLRSQLSPSMGVAVDALEGETFEGQKFTKTGAAAELTVPFIVNDFYEAWTEAGGSTVKDFVRAARTGDRSELKTAFAGGARALPSVLGISSAFYEKAPERRRVDASSDGGGDFRDFGDFPELPPPPPTPLSPEVHAHNAQVDAVMEALRAKVGVEGDLTSEQRHLLMTRLGKLVRGAAEFKPDGGAVTDLTVLRKNLAEVTGEVERDWKEIVEGVRRPAEVVGADVTSSGGLPPPPAMLPPPPTGAVAQSVMQSSLMNLEGVRESSNVEDRRTFGQLYDEVQRKGVTPLGETEQADIALLLDSLDMRRFSDFARRLDEAASLGRVGEGAVVVSEYGAAFAGAFGSKGAEEGRRVLRALKTLARERRLRPTQFSRDVVAGKYGEALRYELVEEPVYYPENHFPWQK
jgi:hypothetical protein